MNILILGAGRVGESVAESLVSENNNITIVDTDPSRLQELQARLDLRVVVGNGIQPSVLEQAGAADADMLIACAANDETNLVACKVAHERFNLPRTIARMRSPEFVENDPLISRDSGFGVDHIVCPEQIVTDYIEKLIDYPEALQVLEFAGGMLNLIAVRAIEGSPLVKHRLGEIPSLVPACELRVRVNETDMFLALTNDDETNIMSALLAKQMGAAKVLAIVNRKAYADLVQGTQIDVALSPAHAAIGSFLTYVRRGNVVAVHSLRRGTAEALEGIVLGDRKSSRMAQRRVDQIKLPKGASIGAIVRKQASDPEDADQGNAVQVLMPHHDTVIEAGDHVVIFVSNKKDIYLVEKLFQVEASYL
ncbi:MAG: Trk system potassium transport protein TrkA [Betaproteobacteria bacterium]|nr:Trk system potassium transport protein TrkA [Betaproteobacteria bacterium]